MNIITKNEVTAVILAGGMGRRMGGQDKGLVLFKDRPLIQHVIDAISQQMDNIIINANRNIETYASLGYPVIEDSLEDFQGPLAGFYAAMQQVKTPYILTLPCDGPYVSGDYLQCMLDVLNQQTCEMVIASDGERMQPVYALIPVVLKDSLHQFLQQGDRKIDRWYQGHQFALAQFDPASHLFTNINSIDDMQESLGT